MTKSEFHKLAEEKATFFAHDEFIKYGFDMPTRGAIRNGYLAGHSDGFDQGVNAVIGMLREEEQKTDAHSAWAAWLEAQLAESERAE